jgi:predicted lipoprotein with Yx(FWY)xxD motif
MEPEAAMDEAELSVATDSALGEFLVGNGGMTLYMFTRDEPNMVNCAGDCLVQWPPLITQGEPVLGEGVDPALVGTAEMEDGSLIVTYNEMPLYYWFADTQPGDTTGQGVGDVWFVVSPEGEAIGMDVGMETPQAAMDEAELNVVTDPALGDILVGKNGMTLYMFANDEPNTVNCEGNCLVNWPPLVTEGEPVLGEGVDPDLVGTAELPDGQMIVTYNEMPLYYWKDDTQPGDTTGQGVGDVWYVVSPEGEIVR